MVTKRLKTVFVFFLYVVPVLISGQSKAITVNSENSNIDYATNRYAFIVGNDHYSDPTISSLTSCRLDAQRVASFLQSKEGFYLSKENTTLLLDAKKKIFISKFNLFLENIPSPKESIVYFYYSGHGLQGTIVPTDYKNGDSNSIISYDWIVAQLEKHGIAARVYIIDACYAGSILDVKGEETTPPNFSKVFKNKSQNTIAFTATTSFRVTPAGKHESLFTKTLLTALSSSKTDINIDAVITAGELFNAIEKEIGVANAPQFSGVKEFPMGNLKASRGLSQYQKLKPSYNTSDDIVSWRTFIESKGEDKEYMESTIATLETDTTLLAKAKLGFLYVKGIGVVRNEQKALTYLIPAALGHNSFAQYNLGYIYSKGIGLSRDKNKAYTYYTMAAQNGDPFAQHNLGSHYYELSKTHPQGNLKKAMNWFIRAAEQQLPISQTALGILYEELSENCTSKNIEKKYSRLALHYYKKAAMQNFGYGQFKLAQYYKKKENTDSAVEQSNYWLKSSCGNNYLRACTALLK